MVVYPNRLLKDDDGWAASPAGATNGATGPEGESNARSAARVRLPAKVLVYSPVLPPHDAGQAIVLYRLFRGIRPRDYCLVSFTNGPPPPTGPSPVALPSLPGRAYRFRGDWAAVHPGTTYPLQPIRDARRFGQEALRRAAALVRIIRREECRAIIAASGMLPDLPAALLASWLTGARLVVYMFDHWRYKEEIPAYRRMAGALEGAILKAATRVVVPNEMLGAELKRLYGSASDVIRNPLDDGATVGQSGEVPPWPVDPTEIRVVFTGQVYEAHFDAFRHLMSALEAPDLRNVRLHIYTAQTEADLARGGIAGRVTLHPHVPPPEIHAIQRRADVLFLPLAFDSPYPRIIRTSAPTKLGDYLASGRPMLVHAPAESFPIWFARHHQCGVAVDRPAPALLADAIRQIRDDAALRARIGANARRVATEFSPEAARAALVALLRRGM